MSDDQDIQHDQNDDHDQHEAPEQGLAPDALDESTGLGTPEQGAEPAIDDPAEPVTEEPALEEPASEEPAAKPVRRRARRPVAATFSAPDEPVVIAPLVVDEPVAEAGSAASEPADPDAVDTADPVAPRRRRARRPVAMPTFQTVDPALAEQAARAAALDLADTGPAELDPNDTYPTGDHPADPAGGDGEESSDGEESGDGSGPRRRRRGRRGRGRGRGDGEQGESESGDDAAVGDTADDGGQSGDGEDSEQSEDGESGSGGTKRRRRRRRSGSAVEGEEPIGDDPPNTVVKVREPRSKKGSGDDGVRGVSGSTRLEAKRQRRRDGRGGSRRPPIVTESEYLARRESVERTMLVRNQGERTQIAVLEDGVLVEHYVTRASATSYAGNVYLGKVQNVLPSMEAAFIDIGKGRNAVLYAGEVNYDGAAEGGGRARSIQEALKSGQNVLAQVTKDPIGQKGARLTSQVTLPGRYLVYVPEGSMTGISRKLPDTERARLKTILKKIVPDEAGVIIRTAAEGASEEELTRDVERLQAQWGDIQQAAKKAEKHAPAILHAEPDLVVRVVRDVFNEDFTSLVVQGDAEWETIGAYVSSVAPDLLERTSRWTSEQDVFAAHRVTEQLVRALDRKVHLPSGGSLVIDRTEAMTVVDVNTGRFTGKGGNLEETVTKNNLEAAEEIVRQLRLRDVGGIIVIDFIDMVLESNRDLVLRRLTECLGRDRTRHQVAEVTSLGLVQMTRKRVGTGLIEAYSEPCLACQERGVIIHMDGPPARSENHVHEAPKRRGPVPRPPDVRPDDAVVVPSPTAEGSDEVSDEGSDEAAAVEAPEPDGAAAAPDADVEVGAHDDADAAASDDDDAIAVADDIEVEVAAPKRRRRRATSGGPVSAIPEDVTA